MQQLHFKFPSDAIGRLVGFLFLALVPLVTLVQYNAIPVWLTQDLVLRWTSVLMFLFCLLSYFTRSKIFLTIQLDFPNLILLLLTGWVLLSVKNSQQPFDSFYAFKSFLALVLTWFSLRMIWNRWPELFPWFEKVFFWTAVIASIWLILSTVGHHFQVSFFADIVPRKGFFPNENIAAGLLGMAFLWGAHQRLHKKSVSLFGMALLILAWGLTDSRGSFVSMMLVIVLYLILHMREVESILRRWTKSQWVWAGITMLFFLTVLCWKGGMVDRFLNAEETDSRSYFRIDVWISSFKMIMAQPLFGFGPGTFADVYPYFQPSNFWNIFNPFAHNEYLQVAADCGLPAMVLVLLLLWILMRELWGTLWKASAFKWLDPALAAGEITFYIVLLEALHNSVDFTFHEWSHQLVLLGFVTYALKERKVKDDLTASIQFSRRVFFSATITLIFFIIWILGVGALQDYLAQTYDYQGKLFLHQGDLDKAEDLEKKSIRLRPDSKNPWNTLGAIEDVRAGTSKKALEREKHFQSAEDYYRKAIQFSPYFLDPLENQVKSMVAQGKLDGALDLQRQLIAKAPQIPIHYLNLALMLLQAGRSQEALVAAQKSIDLDYYFIQGYSLKGRSLEALGRKKEALNTYEKETEILKNFGLSDTSGQIELHIQKLKSQK